MARRRGKVAVISGGAGASAPRRRGCSRPRALASSSPTPHRSARRSTPPWTASAASTSRSPTRACSGRARRSLPGPVNNAFQHTIEVTATGSDEAGAAAIFEEMIRLGCPARPEEIAHAALFLASDESRFVTGAAVPVDGGMRV